MVNLLKHNIMRNLIKLTLIIILSTFTSIQSNAQWRKLYDFGANSVVYKIFEFKGNLIASTNSGIYCSKDSGSIWKLTDTQGIVREVKKIVANDSFLFAVCGPNDILNISKDSGQTWININDKSLGVTPGSSRPSSIRNIYVFGNTLLGIDLASLLISKNNGRNWQRFIGGSHGLPKIIFRPHFFYGPMIQRANSLILFYNDLQTSYISNDSGQSWKLLCNSITTDNPDILIPTLGIGQYLLTVLNDTSIVRTDDKTCSWNINYVANSKFRTIITHNKVLIAGFYGDGVLMSKDSGNHWSLQNQGLTYKKINDLTIFGDKLYACAGQYVFSSNLSEFNVINDSYLETTNTIKVYPNPTLDLLNFELSENIKDGTLVIYNTLGDCVNKLMFHQTNKITINTTTYPKGIYFYYLIGEKSTRINGKFTKQ